MQKNKLWLFGDSFVCSNTGWINKLSVQRNLEVVHLGTAGGSIGRLLKELNREHPNIKENDRVIIVYTACGRYFFDNRDFSTPLIELEENEFVINEYNEKITEYAGQVYTKKEIESFKEFSPFLFTPTSYDQNAFIIRSIHNFVLPTLRTKYIAELFAFDFPHQNHCGLYFPTFEINYDFKKYPLLGEFIDTHNLDWRQNRIHIEDNATDLFLETYKELFKNF